MATGSDVREIFQLKPSEGVRRVHKAEKKPDGISRELYGLIGNNVSTVAFNNPTYKPKFNRTTKAVSWTWRPFVNPSREDDLVLHHWEKTRTDPNEEYRFYKFNTVISLQEFTPEEYQQHLQDPDWTLSETMYLWDLCRTFDLRWVVITDRYEWPLQDDKHFSVSPSTAGAATSSTPLASHTGANGVGLNGTTNGVLKPAPKVRTMEDLKNRYYTVNRILIKMRMTDSNQAAEKAQLLSSMSYDKLREVERKRNLEVLNTRTPEQLEEEEALFLEARRIDQNEKKITRERENLLRLLNNMEMFGPATAGLTPTGSLSAGGPGSGIIIPSNSITIPSSTPGASSSKATNGTNNNAANNTPAPAPAAAPANGQVKKRKKAPKGSTDESAPAAAPNGHTKNASTSSASGSGARRPSASTAMADAVEPPPVPIKKEKLTPGAYLRSQKVTPVVSTKLQRVQNTLVQLGIPLKPTMPTQAVMAKWEQLQNNIVLLLDLKKQADKLEADIKVARVRKGGATLGSGTSGAGSSTSGLGGVGLYPASSVGANNGGGGSTSGDDYIKREGTADESAGQKRSSMASPAHGGTNREIKRPRKSDK